MCWLLFVATALSFLDRQVLSVLAPTLMAEFRINNTTYSRVVFCFVLSYTVMFSVGGRLMDRWGTRLGMALAVGVWSAASAAHAVVAGAMGLAAVRFLLGFGEGGCFPGATRGAVEWFPPQQRGLAIGIATGGAAFGAVLSPPLTAWLAVRFGWRAAFLVTGALGASWVAAWIATFRLVPAIHGAPPRSHAPSLKSVLADSDVWKILVARFLFDPVFYFLMFWIPQYLSRERHFSLEQIGSYFWIPFLVLGISQVGSGRVADAFVRRGRSGRRARLALLTFAALLTPVSCLAVVAPTATWAIAVISVLMFAHGFWITNFLGFLSDNFPSEIIATVTGLSGTAGGIGGMISSLLVGPVVDRYSFAPVFLACGLSYPLALAVLFTVGAGCRAARSRADLGPTGTSSGV